MSSDEAEAYFMENEPCEDHGTKCKNRIITNNRGMVLNSQAIINEVEKRRNYRRRYYEKNKERYQVYQKAYKAKKKEKLVRKQESEYYGTIRCSNETPAWNERSCSYNLTTMLNHRQTNTGWCENSYWSLGGRNKAYVGERGRFWEVYAGNQYTAENKENCSPEAQETDEEQYFEKCLLFNDCNLMPDQSLETSDIDNWINSLELTPFT